MSFSFSVDPVTSSLLGILLTWLYLQERRIRGVEGFLSARFGNRHETFPPAPP